MSSLVTVNTTTVNTTTVNTTRAFLAEPWVFAEPRVFATAMVALIAFVYLYKRVTNGDPYYGIPREPGFDTPWIFKLLKFIMINHGKVDIGRKPIDLVQDSRYQFAYWGWGPDGDRITVNSPQLVRDLLVDGQRQYREGFTIIRDPFIKRLMQIMFTGPNIANESGDEWKWRRRMMMPMFQPRKLVPEILPYVAERTNKLAEFLGAKNGDPVEVDNLMTFLTFDVICKYMFGRAGPEELDFTPINGYHNSTKAMADIVDGFQRSYVWTLLPIIGRTRWAQEPALTARKRVRGFTRGAILRCMADDEQGREEGLLPVVSLLAKTPQFDPTDEEGLETLTSDMVGMMFAGHDTTAHTLAFTLGHIAKDPEVQSKVLEEVLCVLGPGPLEPGNINAADLSKLVYITAVTREAGRMYPPIPYLFNVTTKEVAIGEAVVPPGTPLRIHLRATCMNPSVFENPFEFNPSRWLAEKGDGLVDFDDEATSSRLPDLNFGVGGHACLGRNLAMIEIRTVVAMLVHRFEIGLKPGSDVAPVQPSLVKPRGGMWLTFKERA